MQAYVSYPVTSKNWFQECKTMSEKEIMDTATHYCVAGGGEAPASLQEAVDVLNAYGWMTVSTYIH